MKKEYSKVIAVIISLWALWASVPMKADDLVSLMQSAKVNNNSYQAGLLDADIHNEDVHRASSAFFPHVTVSGNAGRGNGKSELSLKFPYIPTLPVEFEATSQIYTINASITEVLFDLSNIKQYLAAKDMAKAFALQKIANEQELMFQVVAGYFAVLKAIDKQQLVQAQIASLTQQFKIATDKVYNRSGTNLERSEAETSLKVAKTEADFINNQKRDAVYNLRVETGKPLVTVNALKTNILVSNLHPTLVQYWIKTVLDNNIDLKIARFKLQAAKENWDMKRAKSLPMVYAEASAAKAQFNAPVFNTVTQTNLGVVVGAKVELFSGGYINAESRQAELQYRQHYLMYRAAEDKLLDAVQDLVGNIFTLVSKIETDRQAILTATQTLQSAQHAYQVGVRNIIDSLEATKVLRRVKTSYQEDLYDYLLLKMKLYQLAGQLDERCVNQLNAELNHANSVALSM